MIPAADAPSRHRRWLPAAVVFVTVLGAALWLVAAAGTDIPFYDQWDLEGSWLYPAWREGSLRLADLVRPHNEHHILWSHLLNLGLFVANGQWDPLVQLGMVAGVRSATAAVIALWAGDGQSGRARWLIAAGVALAYLPLPAWHAVLWGIESFVLILSMLALWLLGTEDQSGKRTGAGLLAGVAALFAMGPGELVPVALLGFAMLKAVETRRLDRAVWRLAWPALVLLVAALALRVPVPAQDRLAAATGGQFCSSLGRLLSWPHEGQPIAALLMNLPLVLVLAGRVWHYRRPVAGESFVLLAAGWSLAIVLAAAWVRGGGDELAVGVPSRYVDFLVLLPLANGWCLVALVRETMPRWRASARLVAAAWGVFLLAGWLGLSAQVMRGIVLPRRRDREAPVRLMREFQRTGDAAVFAGQPRLLVPHPNLDSVRAVLRDPRMQGVLPPSLQPDRPMGPLSRAVRWLLGR